MADKDLDLDVKSGGNKTTLLLIILIVLVLIVGGVGGYMLFAGGDKETTEASEEAEKPGKATTAVKAPAKYLALKPEFTINFADSSKARFLQLEVTVMARDQAALSAVEKHMPVVQDNIINILAGKSFEQLNLAAGKHQLADEILKSIQEVVAQESEQANVEAVYFTSFIMQ